MIQHQAVLIFSKDHNDRNSPKLSMSQIGSSPIPFQSEFCGHTGPPGTSDQLNLKQYSSTKALALSDNYFRFI